MKHIIDGNYCYILMTSRKRWPMGFATTCTGGLRPCMTMQHYNYRYYATTPLKTIDLILLDAIKIFSFVGCRELTFTHSQTAFFHISGVEKRV